MSFSLFTLVFLGKELKSRYDIPDRRNTPGYDSWRRNFEEIAQYVRENA